MWAKALLLLVLLIYRFEWSTCTWRFCLGPPGGCTLHFIKNGVQRIQEDIAVVLLFRLPGDDVHNGKCFCSIQRLWCCCCWELLMPMSNQLLSVDADDRELRPVALASSYSTSALMRIKGWLERENSIIVGFREDAFLLGFLMVMVVMMITLFVLVVFLLPTDGATALVMEFRLRDIPILKVGLEARIPTILVFTLWSTSE